MNNSGSLGRVASVSRFFLRADKRYKTVYFYTMKRIIVFGEILC